MTNITPYVRTSELPSNISTVVQTCVHKMVSKEIGSDNGGLGAKTSQNSKW